jgi:hypothetical protein
VEDQLRRHSSHRLVLIVTPPCPLDSKMSCDLLEDHTVLPC